MCVSWVPRHSATADKCLAAKCAYTIQTPGENINICWSPDSQTIGVGNKEDVISFIDTRQWKIFREFNNEGEANEIGWDLHGSHFIITTGLGSVKMLDWPSLQPVHTMQAHTASVYCFEVDPRGRYMALGAADAIVSIWDTEDLVCVRTITSLEWPVRSLSFAYDGEILAAGSEDRFIDIVGRTCTGLRPQRILMCCLFPEPHRQRTNSF